MTDSTFAIGTQYWVRGRKSRIRVLRLTYFLTEVWVMRALRVDAH